MIEYLLILSADKVQIGFLSIYFGPLDSSYCVTIILGLINGFHYQYPMNHASLKETIEVYSLSFLVSSCSRLCLINKRRKH
jgi:hypothetical protein